MSRDAFFAHSPNIKYSADQYIAMTDPLLLDILIWWHECAIARAVVKLDNMQPRIYSRDQVPLYQWITNGAVEPDDTFTWRRTIRRDKIAALTDSLERLVILATKKQ